jgi:ATP-dependent DNA helicase RecG
MQPNDPLSVLKGIGDAQSSKYAVLGVKSIADLIYYFPRTYDDYSKLSPIAKLKPGNVSLQATIKHAKGRYVRRRMHITEAIASDSSGSVRLIWFNQPYRAASIKSDQQYYISGNYELSRSRFSLINPAIELASDFPANTARIISIYRETKGLSSREIRLAVIKVKPLIEQLDETLPEWIIKDFKLMSRAEALLAIHMPESPDQLAAAQRRLGLEEVFELSLASLMNKQEIKTEKALKVKFKQSLAQDFVKHLPFTLTDSQRLAIWQTYQEIELDQPMNRLVEGDVGSGKTVVAAMAGLMVLAAKKQVALMAPTELLARQHFKTISKLLKPLSYGDSVVLLVGSMNKKQKDQARQDIKSGKAGFIIGTQALIQEQVDMKQLALIVIDEQHRFGVDQRKALMLKSGHMPHVLSLTATPIPRSLALTLFGELDISQLKQKPSGRQPIETKIVRANERPRLFEAIRQQIQSGRQAFVVCPSISESAVLNIKSVEKTYQELANVSFKEYRVGLLHGKLKPAEKVLIMEKFVSGEIDILVSTTVIEVGVDVPNATIMMVESPERFGLAQLHQLRGRVGRGLHQGYCYLLTEDDDSPSKRIRALVSSNDGFQLAEMDLDIRGPGAIYGTLQHGSLDLRIAKLTDAELIQDAIAASRQFIERGEDLLEYKELNRHIKRLQVVTNLN